MSDVEYFSDAADDYEPTDDCKEGGDDAVALAEDSDESPVVSDEEPEAESSSDSDVDAPGSDNESTRRPTEYERILKVVLPENRRTSHILSKYEMTDIVSTRSEQISKFNNCMVDCSDLDEPIAMAKRELVARMCPLLLEREVGVRRNDQGGFDEYVEIWDPNTMFHEVTYTDVL